MSKQFKIYPLAGIDNASTRDDALQVRGDAPATYVRDAVNVDIDEGRASMRPVRRQVCSTPYTDLWRSSLHGDLFGRLGGSWVRINPQDWGFELLADAGEQQLHHIILNNLVAVAGANGIFTLTASVRSLWRCLVAGHQCLRLALVLCLRGSMALPALGCAMVKRVRYRHW